MKRLIFIAFALETWSKSIVTKTPSHQALYKPPKSKKIPSCLSGFVAKSIFSAAFLALTLSAIGCQQPLPQEGLWHGSITLRDNKELPVQMFLSLQSSPPSGYFLVGSERTPIPELYQRGDSVVLVISEYGAAIRTVWSNNRLSGSFFRYRSDTTSLAFEASPQKQSGEPSTKVEKATDVPLVGKYQVYFHQEKSVDSLTTATFWMKNDSIYGTFVAPDGDYGLMVGKQEENNLRLGRFTGWQANLIELSREGNSWSGKYYARSNAPVSLTLEPRPSLPKEMPGAKKTRMKDPKKAFTFSGITMSGDTVTQLDPRFKGKVLIVDIMGTWCHNCMDASPLLQKVYTDFHNQGLEIIGLSFELSNDFQTAKKNLKLYQDRFGITFPLLFCGTTEDANVDAKFRSQVEDFFAYPTTFFIGRDGRAKHIHVGFKGPGTGEEFQQEVEMFYKIVKELMGSKK